MDAGQIQNILAQLTNQITDSNPNSFPDNIIPNKNNNNKNNRNKRLTPAQLLVIIGILSGSLQVDSIALDKDQTVQILLAGTLKRKNQLDKMFDEIGDMPFEQVFKAMMDRIG